MALKKSGHDTIRDIFIEAHQHEARGRRENKTNNTSSFLSNNTLSFLLLFCLLLYVSYALCLIWSSGDELLLYLWHILSYNIKTQESKGDAYRV